MSFELAVFHEFEAKEALATVGAIENLQVDIAASPSTFVKEDAEKQAVATNAKLFFPEATPEEEVDVMVAKLVEAGFTVVKRKPITSAGCPMLDRVILRFGA
eukprot:375473_1